MKRQIVQPMRVTLIDGSVIDACCGPAVARMATAVRGYLPVGNSSEGVCCHVRRVNATQEWVNAAEWERVREWLREQQWRAGSAS